MTSGGNVAARGSGNGHATIQFSNVATPDDDSPGVPVFWQVAGPAGSANGAQGTLTLSLDYVGQIKADGGWSCWLSAGLIPTATP
jgi:hypothetical protein